MEHVLSKTARCCEAMQLALGLMLESGGVTKCRNEFFCMFWA